MYQFSHNMHRIHRALARGLSAFVMCALISSSFVFPQTAAAQFNPEINYQGKLTLPSGVAVTDGTYEMEFSLYTVATAGSPIWTETRNGADEVTVTNGLFSIMLGEVATLAGVDFNQTLYLGVTIESDDEMEPRKILGAVPAAFVAGDTDTLDGLDSTQFVRTDTPSTITASSSSPLLTINQTGAGDIFALQQGGTDLFNVLNNGNVGIGTTAPNTLLHIEGTSGLDGATPVGLTIKSSNNGTWTDEAILGQLLFDSADTNGTAGTRGAIKLYADDTSGADNGLSFWTTSSGVTGIAERMRIDHNGNVGIGATSLTGKFNVIGGVSLFSSFGTPTFSSLAENVRSRPGLEVVSRPAAGHRGGLHVYVSGQDSGTFLSSTGAAQAHWSSGAVQNNGQDHFTYLTSTAAVISHDEGVIRFSTQSGLTPEATGSISERMRITETGNVGIGTTSPSELLHVAGDARIEGALFDSTNSAGTAGFVLQTTGAGTEWVATSSLGFAGAGDLHDAVTLAGGYDYLTLSGQQITLGQIDLATDVTGTLTVGDGGTGATSLTGLLLGNGTSAFTATTTLASSYIEDAYVLNTGDTISGNISIGTTTANARLSVQSTGVADILNLFETGGTEVFTVLESGNIGIGTTTPASKLSVVGTNSASGAKNIHFTTTAGGALTGAEVNFLSDASGSGTAWSSVWAKSSGSGSAYAGYFDGRSVFVNGNVGIGTTAPASLLEVQGGLTTTGAVLALGTKETTVVANDVLGRINFYAPLEADGSDAILTGASVAAIAEGTFGAASNATSLVFQTGASETATTKMTILSSGNVGIGDTTPTQTLTVTGNQSTSGYLRVGSETAPNNTTAGDLTSTRLSVGNTAISGTGFASFTGTLTEGGATAANAMLLQPIFTPSSANTSQLRGLNVNAVWTGANSIALGYGSNYVNDFRLSGSAGVTNSIIGFNGTGVQLNANSNNFGTINRAVGAAVQAVSSFGNTVTGTITAGVGFLVTESTVTSQTFTGQAGLNVGALSAATNNTAILLGTNTIPSGNFGIYNASTNNNYFAGNIGIGATSPSTPLQIDSNNNALADVGTIGNYTAWLRNPQNDDNEGVGIAFSLSTSATNIGAAIIHKRTGNNGAGELQFYTKQSTTMGADPVQAMVINSSGNVGIGTTSPSELLHVAGDTRIEGALFDSTNSAGTAGFVLQSTGIGTEWVATSSLGISGTSHDAVTLAGGYDYLTLSGQQITLGQIDLATDVTGTLPVLNGGTGITSFGTGVATALGQNVTGSGSIVLATSPTLSTLTVSSGGIAVTGNSTIAGTLGSLTGLTSSGTITFSGITSGLVYANGSGVLSATSTISSSLIADAYLLNTGDTATGDYNFDAGTLFIDAAGGQVGVGTTTPSKVFHVVGNQPQGMARFERIATSGNNIPYGTIQLMATTYGDMSDGFGAGMTFYIKDSAGVDNPIADIQAIRDGADNSGALKLQTYNAGSITEKMRISPAGNVGIGDTSPTYLLTVGNGDLFGVNSSGAIAAATGITSSGTITFSGITSGLVYANGSGVLSATSTISSSLIADAYVLNTGDTISGDISIGTTTANARLSVQSTGTSDILNLFETGGTEVFTVLESGSVGISTIAPEVALHITSGTSAPQTSGTTASGSFALETTNDNGLYFGSYGVSPFGSWIQASNRADLSIEYPIILNPNGGAVAVGDASPSATSFQVGGGSLQANTWFDSYSSLFIDEKTVPGSDDDHANTLIDLTLNSAGNTNEFNTALVSSITTKSGNAHNFGSTIGAYLAATHQGSGTVSALYGGISQAVNASSGTVTALAGLAAEIYNSGGGTVTSAYGLRISNLVNSSGTLTNTYGIHIGDMTTGTQTNTAFSLYSSDANALSYFAGNVGLNTTGPDRRLDILDASSPQLRLTHTDGSVYADFQMDSNGDLIMGVDGTTNQFVLDNAGRIGIGTAAPATTVEVSASGATTLRVTSTDSNASPAVQIADANSRWDFVKPNNSRLELRLTGSMLFAFTNGGNFGIGDSSPAHALTVGNGDLFGVNSSGAIAAITGLSGATGTYDFGGATSFELPNGASGTTNVFGQIFADNDAWAASRGALQFYDGTANTLLVGVLASDTPSNGQVPVWNTGGTITWETVSGGASAFLDLTDTPGSWTTNAIPYESSNALAFSSGFTFDGSVFITPGFEFEAGVLTMTSATTFIVPNNTTNAWSIATSTSGSPLFSINSTTGSETVEIGVAGGDVIIGAIGAASNLVFEESSTIHGQGANTLTFGITGDAINFGVNVGIGTTTAERPLSVVSATNAAIHIYNSANHRGAYVGLIDGYNTALDSAGGVTLLRSNGASYLTVGDGGHSYFNPIGGGYGNVGIGNTSPGALLDLGSAGTTAGVLRFAGSTSGNVTVNVAAAAGTWTMTLPTGAGSNGQQLQTNGSGVTSWAAAGSTAGQKNVIGQMSPQEAFATIIDTPVYRFHYKPGKGTLDEDTEYVGIMAHEAPWAMHYDGTILNPVNALGYTLLGIQALNLKLEDLATTTPFLELDEESFTARFFTGLFAQLTTWFADATNGIGDMFAGTFRATDQLCIGDTCVNEAQLIQLLNQENSGGSYSPPPTPPPPPPEEEPPADPEEPVEPPAEEGPTEGPETDGGEDEEGGEEPPAEPESPVEPPAEGGGSGE